MIENLMENQKKMFEMWQGFFKNNQEVPNLPFFSMPAEVTSPFLKMDKSSEFLKDFYQFFKNFQNSFATPTNFYNFPEFQNLFNNFQKEYSNIILKIMGLSDLNMSKILENFSNNFLFPNMFQNITELMKNPYIPNIGSFENMLKMPSFWLTRELNDLVKDVINNLLEYSKKVEEFKEIISEQSKKAFDNFLEELKKQPQIEDFDKFFKKWVDANEKIFQDFFKSKEYGEILRNLLKAGAQLKSSLDKYTQQILKESNIATKYELDRAYKEIYLLKKEIKSLKNKIKDLEEITKKEADK